MDPGDRDGIGLSQRLSQVYIETPVHLRQAHHHHQQEQQRVVLHQQPTEADPQAEIERGLDTIDENQDMMYSQDLFCTPDFITPVEQQFAVDLAADKENETPVRTKRPRSDDPPTPLPQSWQKEGGVDDVADDDAQESQPPVEQVDLGQAAETVNIPALPKFPSLPGPTGTGPMRARNMAAYTLPPPPPSMGLSRTNAGKFEKDAALSKQNAGKVESAIARAARLGGVRKRVQSPPCVKNPFLDEEAEWASDHQQNRPHGSGIVGNPPSCRYREEFHEIQEIGRGNFSRVYKVRKRIDGCLYAVKRTIRQLFNDRERKQALTEVQALAAVGLHPNIVRYHSAWYESDYLHIQTELCSGTLSQAAGLRGGPFPERELVELLKQVAGALVFIHSKNIAHLDLKPDNIFYVIPGGVQSSQCTRVEISRASAAMAKGRVEAGVKVSAAAGTIPSATALKEAGPQECAGNQGDDSRGGVDARCSVTNMETDRPSPAANIALMSGSSRGGASSSGAGCSTTGRRGRGSERLGWTYKIGDFGRATLLDGSMSVEEGDARYLPLEILNDDYKHLTKADIFSLGATVYELARGSPLPSTGPQFQAIRNGKLPALPGISLTFHNLIKAMMNLDPRHRPSADDILRHQVLTKDGGKGKPEGGVVTLESLWSNLGGSSKAHKKGGEE